MYYREEADRVFSIALRLSYADHAGYVSCYTCGARLLWSEVDCGHFIPRGNSAVRYNKKNCRPQCFHCNRGRGGMPEAFEERLREDFGNGAVDALIALGRSERQFTQAEYKEIIHKAKEEIRARGVTI